MSIQESIIYIHTYYRFGVPQLTVHVSHMSGVYTWEYGKATGRLQKTITNVLKWPVRLITVYTHE